MPPNPPAADVDLPPLMSVAQALAIIDAAPVTRRVIELALPDAAGLRLAEDLKADCDYPPFNKSLMDGYAVRSADFTGSGAARAAALQVIGEIAAGNAGGAALQAGCAISIMTGAPMPGGADAVAAVEDVEPLGDSQIKISVRAAPGMKPGLNIARTGSDFQAGGVALHQHQALSAPQIAVAASIGAHRVRVFARARVAVLATGSEIVPIDAAPQANQIRNSNGPLLVSLLQRLGCEVADFGCVADDPALIREAVEAGLAYDALFISGGMSMGKYDYVPGILREMGLTLEIAKVRMKPGKPFIFARREDPDAKTRSSLHHPHCNYVFGLPGNPVSAFVCTVRLASRLLMRMAGGTTAESASERWMSGRLLEGLLLNGPCEFYQPAIYTIAAGGKSAQNEIASVKPLMWKSSADVFTLSQANALIVRAENEPAAPKGTLIRVIGI